MKLEGNSILITGASSGIGAALADALARRGARLTLLARREERLRSLARRLAAVRDDLPPPLVFPCDITDASRVGDAVRAAVRVHGGLDVLINNAGISAYGPDVSAQDLRRLMEVNFFAAIGLMQAVLPEMRRAGRGQIVNVASLAALHGVPYLAAYGATKAALVNFSQSLRAELAGSGIGVTVVYPYYTDTELFAREVRTKGARRPEHRYVPAERVAEAIVWALLHDRHEVVLTRTGTAMRWASRLTPGLLDRAMRFLAHRLREEETNHVQA